MHLAAESHVDRSIDGPGEFIQTNVVGTFHACCRPALDYWRALVPAKRAERSASITSRPTRCSARSGPEGLFREDTPYAAELALFRLEGRLRPSRARLASHLRAADVVTNCSNNYGPYHFPEKLIPLMILNALEGKPLPVYGSGENIRDWLYVEDHAEALLLVAAKGGIGESYNVGGAQRAPQHRCRQRDLRLLDELAPARQRPAPRTDHLRHGSSRPRSALRHRLHEDRARTRLAAGETFETGLRKTVRWYLDNPDWWGGIRSGVYRGERLGRSIEPPLIRFPTEESAMTC